jgi:acyl-CoA synthetase (AMP-forming)/AMP-acid ligase II
VDPRQLLSRIPGDPFGKAADGAYMLKVMTQAGAVGPVAPHKLAQMGRAYARWGNSPATAAVLASIRFPDDTYIEDELGSLTFGEVERRSNALARQLREKGVASGDGLAIMARNHRGFIDATLAGSKLGCNILYLNTMFAAPQLVDVMKREEPAALIYDEEFAGLLEDIPSEIPRFVAWSDGDDNGAGVGSSGEKLEDLISSGDGSPLDPPDHDPRFTILTSGTTGTPKGAQRKPPAGLAPLAALIDSIPYRQRDKMMIAAPLFHSWGFTHMVMSMTLANTLVLRRKFDPEGTLQAVADSGARTLAVVPVMMQRTLRLEDEVLDKFDLPTLEITAASGSALPGELATEWMDRFGDCVYNLYGSTEVAYATIASPADLREAPGTAGRAPRGTIVRIVDENGKDLPQGETGRIFVGNEMAFEGYTGGGGKDMLDGLMSSGDVGHFDEQQRLFVDGRDDEMIVSGGENVFPREVEDLLAGHESVAEVAVIGIDDEDFGQALKAFVVPAGSETLEEKELRSYVKSNLANYKVPRKIEFLDELPRNATGKVLKRELKDDDGESGGDDASPDADADDENQD